MCKINGVRSLLLNRANVYTKHFNMSQCVLLKQCQNNVYFCSGHYGFKNLLLEIQQTINTLA